MPRRSSAHTAWILIAGGILGWLAASGRLNHPLLAEGSPSRSDPQASDSCSGQGNSRAALLAAAAESASESTAPQDSVQKPNILVIFGDDVGWMNVSSYGGDILGVKTPNIDRIGKEGLRLTSFYAQPSCTAGRAAFLTGQLPIRLRSHHGRHTRVPGGLAGGHHPRRDPQDARLCNGAIRQESPWGPRRTPPPPARIRRVLGQPLSPERERRPRRPRSPDESGVPAYHAFRGGLRYPPSDAETSRFWSHSG